MSQICIPFQHGRAIIYDVEDYLKLRFEHRIIGNLVGTPVSYPRNLKQQGMPAVLSPFELQFVLANNVAVLVDKSAPLTTEPSGEQKQIFRELVQQQITELRAPVVQNRLDKFRRHLPSIIEGKRKKLLMKGLKEEDIHLEPELLLLEEQERLKAEVFDPLQQIPLKYPLSLCANAVSFQLSSSEKIKYRVFRTLWERGGYITEGDSFGCDFLYYPGDPLYFHASHVVHVLPKPELRLDVRYIVRICRLAIVVNKICTLAYVDETSHEICFQTLEWEGNVEGMDK